MLAHLQHVPEKDPRGAIGEAVSRSQALIGTICTSVEQLGTQGVWSELFLQSMDSLRGRIQDISQVVRQEAAASGPGRSKVTRACQDVGSLIHEAFDEVVRNAAINDPNNERFFLDHLGELERVWCDPSKPMHRLWTVDFPAPSRDEIESLEGHQAFLSSLDEIYARLGHHKVNCYISYCSADAQPFTLLLKEHLQRAGVEVIIDEEWGPEVGRDYDALAGQIGTSHFALVIGSIGYMNSHTEARLVSDKYDASPDRVVRLLANGTVLRSFPPLLAHSRTGYVDVRAPNLYFQQAVAILERLHHLHSTKEDKSFLSTHKKKFETQKVAPLLAPVTVSPAPCVHPIETRLRTAYAQKPDIRRFMGDEVSFESVYVAPDICSTLLDATRQRVWITGEPGSGKSTLCHYIAYLYGTLQGQELEQRLGSWAKGCSGVVWIPLRDLLLYKEEYDISLEQLVADLRFDGEVIDGLKTWLQSPGLVFLLDSEEEVHHLRDERSQRGRLLKQLLNKPCSIITSRSDERSPKTTKAVVLPPFDHNRVELFVKRYFTDAKKPDQTSLFLESIPHAMRELMQVPLTLELLCYRWSKVEHHATAPILLYQGILADLCRLKAAKQEVDLSTLTDEEVEKKFPALPYLFEIAFQAKKQKKGGFIDSALYSPFLEQIEEGKRLLMYEQLFADETFVRRVGRPSHYSNQTYVFHHAVFMDYCAARHLAPLLVANGYDLKSLIGEEWYISNSFFYWLQTVILAEALHYVMDPMRSPLQRAAASGNLEKVKLLLDGGALIDQTEENGEAPLHLAAVVGHVEVVKLLLERGASIDQVTEGGMTPLHEAAAVGQVGVVKLLLDRGALIDRTEKGGMTPLHQAAFFGHVEVVKLLLNRGAAINPIEEDGTTPLHRAAFNGHIEVVELLLKRGALIDQTDKKEGTPLRSAAISGHVEVAKLLLDRGALIDRTEKGGMTPLHQAAFHGHVEIVKLLLDRGALIDQTTENGATPLHAAAVGGQVEVAKLLLDRGALIDQTAEDGETPLHLAVFSGHVEVAELLLDRGTLIDQTDKNGMTSLHLAANAGHVEVAELLLDRGALIDQTDRNGMTPLPLAAIMGWVEVAKLLLERGASIDQTDKKEGTPLHLAAHGGHVEVVKLLLDRRALIDQTAENGATPLHLAALRGHVEVVKLLLGRGALIDQTMKDGRTALEVALDKGSSEIVSLLIEYVELRESAFASLGRSST